MDLRDKLVEVLNKCKKVDSGNQIYIWGAGNTTELNWEVIKEEKLIPAAFIDNFKTGKYHDVDIIAPKDIMKGSIRVILISSSVPGRNKEIGKQIESIDKSLEYCSVDEVILGRHSEEVLKVYDLFETEESKKIYAELIMARIDGTYFPNISVTTDDTYFHYPAFKMRSLKEVFLDCGAFVGDTDEQYLFNRLGTFKRIVAIEPDRRNVKCLEKRAERLRDEWCADDATIDVIFGAVGSEEGEISIDGTQERLGTKVSENYSVDKVKLLTVDSLFKDTYYSFLKADVEGFEMEMLKGARESIIKYHPLIAISVYHRTTDIISIPLFIHELNKDYKFEIAQHYYDFSETVLYVH